MSTIQLLSIQSRNSVTSNDVNVPSNITATQAWFQTTGVSQSDLKNPNITIEIYIDVKQPDNSYLIGAGVKYVGQDYVPFKGQPGDPLPQIGFLVKPIEVFKGKTIRGRLIITGGPINIGLQVTL